MFFLVMSKEEYKVISVVLPGVPKIGQRLVKGETPSKFDQKMENFFSSIFNSSLTCEYVYLVHCCSQALNIHKICVLSGVV